MVKHSWLVPTSWDIESWVESTCPMTWRIGPIVVERAKGLGTWPTNKASTTSNNLGGRAANGANGNVQLNSCYNQGKPLRMLQIVIKTQLTLYPNAINTLHVYYPNTINILHVIYPNAVNTLHVFHPTAINSLHLFCPMGKICVFTINFAT